MRPTNHIYRYRLLEAVGAIKAAIDAQTKIFLEALGYETAFGDNPEILKAAIDELSDLRGSLIKLEARIERLKPPSPLSSETARIQ